MPWFKIDDGFHCHPKVFAAGTAAVGLYVRCGSWAAQQTSEGVIPKQVARLYGTPRMIKALIDAGLWHQTGHDCQSCIEVDANSYLIHQYLERNPSRVDIELARKQKTERQQRWRDGKRKQQDNEGHPLDVDADVDASTREHGDAAPTPTHPNPSPVPPTEVQPASPSAPADVPMIGDRPRVPAASQPLVQALTRAGVVVGWDLAPADWLLIEALVKRCGVDVLVQHAASAWHGARTRPRSGRYFLPGWRSLPDIPQDTPAAPALPAVVGGFPARPSTTDQRVQQGLALAARLRAIEEGQQ